MQTPSSEGVVLFNSPSKLFSVPFSKHVGPRPLQWRPTPLCFKICLEEQLVFHFIKGCKVRL